MRVRTQAKQVRYHSNQKEPMEISGSSFQLRLGRSYPGNISKNSFILSNAGSPYRAAMAAHIKAVRKTPRNTNRHPIESASQMRIANDIIIPIKAPSKPWPSRSISFNPTAQLFYIDRFILKPKQSEPKIHDSENSLILW